jgi:hypothetical protein
MATGSYDRLLAWCKTKGYVLQVQKVPGKNGYSWTISLAINEPVAFSAHGRDTDIDGAADSLIEDLATVGAKVG